MNELQGWQRPGEVSPTQERITEQKKFFLRKAENYARATQIGQSTGQDVLGAGKYKQRRSAELQGAYGVTRHTQAIAAGTAPVVQLMRERFSQNRITQPEFSELLETTSDFLLDGVPTENFDIVDVLVGLHNFDYATAHVLRTQMESEPQRAEGVEHSRYALVESMMIRLLDQVPLQRFYMPIIRDLHEVAAKALGPEAVPGEALIHRLYGASVEQGRLIEVVSPHINKRLGPESRKLPQKLRQLLAGLNEKDRWGGELMPTLVVQGADIGLSSDVIMGHPNSYGVVLPDHREVLGDFFLVEPRETHRLPTIEKQYRGFSISFGGENVKLALRLFRDGRVDFGWPLYGKSHRQIDRTFHQLKASDGLVYIKSLLTSLVVDATAPPELFEREARQSVPKLLGEAIRRGESPVDVMSKMVIPQRIEIVRRPDRDESPARGPASPKRWHMARAHARILQEGYQRSQENLDKYLFDLERGYIYPLPEADDRAIRDGLKCYIPPAEKGDRRVGEIVGIRAVLGEGATRQVLGHSPYVTEEGEPEN